MFIIDICIVKVIEVLPHFRVKSSSLIFGPMLAEVASNPLAIVLVLAVSGQEAEDAAMVQVHYG